MKILRLTDLILATLFVAACLFSSACHKSAPKTAKLTRLDWNLKTTLEAYRNNGATDAKWDGPAERALTEFARIRASVTDMDEPAAEIISTNVAAAVQAGCDDPIICYLFVKYAMDQTNSEEAFARALSTAADNMQQSPYPDIRKFYASLRAAQQIKHAANDNPHVPPEVHQYRRQAMKNLADALADKTVPIGEVDDACHEMFTTLDENRKQYEDFYGSIEESLSKNWPDESVAWLLKGEAYIKKAWFARGGGYADKVTDEGWRLFKLDLNTAEESLDHAWKLNPKDPRIAVKMIWVELGQDKGRDRMESWFQRAMELDPDDYDACNAKCLYLEPKWYGSIKEMLSFGRECVQNTNWGGDVPLILVDAHREIPLYYLEGEAKTNYWKQPDVWPDIEASFDRFFELNPDAAGWYYNYAWYAYQAGKWQKFNKLLPKLGAVNYAYFGGKEQFDQMVQTAKQHASENDTQAK